MSLIMVLLIGTIIGLILSRFIFKEKPVGLLRWINQIRIADLIYFWSCLMKGQMRYIRKNMLS